MKATVALIGISNLFLVWKSIDYILNTSTMTISTFDFNELPQQTFEKLGILCDLARLTLIVGRFKNLQSITTRSVNLGLILVSLVFIALGVVWEYYRNLSMMKENVDDVLL